MMLPPKCCRSGLDAIMRPDAVQIWRQNYRVRLLFSRAEELVT